MGRTKKAWAASLCLSLVAAISNWAAAEDAPASPQLPPPAKHAVDFAKEVQPLFARHCYSCHGPDEQESSFRLDLKKVALVGGELGEKPIIPGDSARSPLVAYVAGTDAVLSMPPKGPRLSASDVGLIRAWIDQGANWPDVEPGAIKLTTDHWSFQPIVKTAVPQVKHPFHSAHAIDAFVLQKLQDAKLSPSPLADRPTLIRRLYFDMLGLPPSPAEIKAFVEDRDPQAYDKLVEKVLASPRYGERWARHWLDVVRFAETNGFETNVERPNAWHYRDYVIAAFNNDKPYNEFVFEQIAGDAVGADAATGFLVGGPWDQVKSPDPVLTAMQRSDELADMTSTTGSTFLGLTVGCARCHNHKFDPILQKDYYALQAFFAGVQHGDRPMSKAKSPELERQLAEKQQRVTALREELATLRPSGQRGRTILLDDETLAKDGNGFGTTVLVDKAGHGVNPDGKGRGQKSDAGDYDRFPNISRGRYTWWQNKPGEDVFTYRLAAGGRYRVWLSWGCGWDTHTTDAQYWLDRDGKLETRDDQQLIATINQQQFAEPQPALPSQPLWSGFASAGIHEFKPESVIVVRGGKTGTAITADIIACEEVPAEVAKADAPSQPPLRTAVNAKENTEQFSPVAARFVRFTILATNSGEPCIDELEVYTQAREGVAARNIALASAGTKLSSSGNYAGNPIHQLAHLNDGRYGNSFSWISNTSGTGWVQLELPETATIDRVIWGRDREEQYRDRTATNYVIEVAQEPGKWQTVATSADRLPWGENDAAAPHLAFFGLSQADAARGKQLVAELRDIEEQLKALASTEMVYAGRFVAPRETHRLFRGDPMQPREVVSPDCLTVLGTLGLSNDTSEQQRRVALAKWIASPENPLTARVMANRVWQHHFGTGLVDTPSDFGVNGAKPSHPELLNWLASQLIANNWSIKQLHRLILSSHTYQQSNVVNAAAMQADAQCRLLWRYPPHRLEAETIRDAILATSGNLDLRMGGPGWSTFKPNSNYVRFYDPKEEFGPEDWRRAIYMTKVRMRQDGVFGTFDCPDAGQIAPKRARSTTALQALSLFNSQFILQQAQAFAKRVEGEAGATHEAQVSRAFELAFGRTPDAIEKSSSVEFTKQHGLPALCRALFNSNEFLFLP